jgi:hypothetical protein
MGRAEAFAFVPERQAFEREVVSFVWSGGAPFGE